MAKGVLFQRARELTLRVASSACESDELRTRVANHWADMVFRNPRLFNGPLLSPTSISVADGSAALDVRRSNYAHYLYARSSSELALEQVPGTIFVSLIVPVGGSRFVVGRMAPHTAAPGIVQLPGGGVSDVEDIRMTVVDEAAEELGLTIDPSDLELIGLIIRNKPLDVGAVYKTPTYRRIDVFSAFRALLAEDQATGKPSEFDELFVVKVDAGEGWTEGLGRTVDYLGEIVKVLHEDGFQ